MLPTGTVQYSLKSQWGFSFSTFYLEALTISPLSKSFSTIPKKTSAVTGKTNFPLKFLKQ